MDKQKQIEEMAEIALKNTLSYTCAKQIAMNFYNAGYRKIPENAVVLTREEYNKLCQRIADLQYDKDILNQLEEENVDLKYDKFELKNEISEKDNKIALLEETIDCIKFNVNFTRKETAETFAERLKADVSEDNELHEALNAYLKRDYFEYIDEICKELEGENGNVEF